MSLRRMNNSRPTFPSRPSFPSSPPNPPAPPWENGNGPFISRTPPDIREALDSIVRRAELPAGPPPPRPLEKAPHEDIGQLIKDLLGAVQGVGESLSTLLDKPVNDTIGINGPHRIVDNGLDLGYGLARGAIEKVLERGQEG